MNNEVDEMIKFIEKYPDWVRWIAFLPAATISAFIGLWLGVALTSQLVSDSDNHLTSMVMNFLFGFAFVFVGALVAPNKQLLIAIILFTLIIALNLLGYSYNEVLEMSFEIIACIIGAGLGLYAVVTTLEHSSKV